MNNNIDFEQINNLANQLSIYEYVNQIYELKKNGVNYYCSCPLHIDKTPSLCINSEENYFSCFSCGVSGNLYSFMTKIQKMTFQKAAEKICEMSGVELKILKKCEALDFYKTIKRCHDKTTKIVTNREILDWSYYEQFSDELPQEWIDEDMSEEVLKYYDIRIDNRSNRIVYPVWDNKDNLIGAKGRTRFSNYKELGIAKYMNYKKLDTTDFLIGSKYNRDIIAGEKEVIIFEGIKSGMKLTTATGQQNWLAAETSYLSDGQVKALIGMGVRNVIIAFDSDVCVDKIKKCTESLKRFVNVYWIKNDGSLGEKEAPIDRGIDVFLKLYESRIKI